MNASPSALPITVLIATKNEAINLPKCLGALTPAKRVVVIDSHSTDKSVDIANAHGVDVVQFTYNGSYPKKRQWALENIPIDTEWVMLLDADEVVPSALWEEIRSKLSPHPIEDAFFITKGFHFLGRRFKFGGFSHSAVLLFRHGTARFEHLLTHDSGGMDMEVHERLIVRGSVGRMSTPLVHEDFKGLEAYISRHNQYSTWEADVRLSYLSTGRYGNETIKAKLFGNAQERRRAIKALVIRVPFEHWLWFFYHYFLRLGILEGRRGLIASQFRAAYISSVRAKLYELNLNKPFGKKA